MNKTIPNTPLASTKNQTGNSEKRLARLSKLSTIIFSIVAIYSLYLGWEMRPEEHLTAESGLGYALGIIGGVLMLLLLLYPARKKWRRMRNWGPTSWWFRTHMVFGVLGPIIILYHTNFSLGALNSNTALFTMLLVAISGLFGRYVYVQIHDGLYGAKATFKQLKQDSAYIRNLLNFGHKNTEELNMRLQKVEEMATITASENSGTLKLLALGVSTHFAQISTRRLLRKAVRQQAELEGWNRHERIKKIRGLLKHHGIFFSLTQKIIHLSLYDRLFSLWHILHFPLFLMMILAGIVHVFSVHFY